MGIRKSRNQQEPQPWTLVNRIVFSVSTTAAALSLLAFTTILPSPAAHAASAKQSLPAEPDTARVGQVYYNTTDKREYIYNGQEWVPHDASIDTYVLKKHRRAKPHQEPVTDNGGASQPTAPTIDQGAKQ